MSLRLCVVNLARLEEAHVPAMEDLVRGIGARVVEPGTTIDFRSPLRGPLTPFERMSDYRNTWFAHLVTGHVIETIAAADREGFDAIVVNCFDDPGVREARSLVRAQLFGLSEPTFGYAAMLGERLGGLVPNLPGQVNYVAGQVRAFGLEGRFVLDGVRADCGRTDLDFATAMQDPAPMIARIEDIARGMIDAGAEVIVNLCGGLGMVCEMANRYSIEHAGMQVPWVSPLSVAIKMAEATVRLQRGTGLPGISRAHARQALDPADVSRIRAGFELPPL